MSGAAEVATERQAMIEEVLRGLRQTPKRLPSKYFYDEEGSHLFDRICELDAYYPTRTELAIMESSAGEMAETIGPGAMVVEYGSGASVKTELLLDALESPVACVPIDISREHLQASAERLAKLFPEVEILPLEADYTADFEVPTPRRQASRRLLYFPGSTIGNFDRGPARDFLRSMTRVAGPRGGLLIGVDLIKDPAVLELAYDDPEGVTAAFNLNMLVHLNRELDADFDLESFRHVATWNAAEGRVEMHLESTREHTVEIEGERFELGRGERICTEHSNKFEIEEFARLAGDAGWRVERVWTDPRSLFSVQYLVLEES